MHINTLSNAFLALVSLNLVNLVFATPVQPRGTPAQRCSHTQKVYVTTTVTRGSSVTPAPSDIASSSDGTLPPASNTQYWKSCTTTVTKTRTKKVKPPKTNKFTLSSASFPATYAESNIDTSSATPTSGVPTVAASPVLVGSSLYTNPLDAIKPQPTNRLFFGSDNSDGTFLVANAGIKAKQGNPLINIEEFLNYISTVSCSASSISVTFKDATSYGIAASKWAQPFVLITSGSKYCGTDDGLRSYYKVASATMNKSNNQVTLSVSSTNLDDSVASWSLTWGTYDKVTAGSKKREEMDELEEAALLVSNHYSKMARRDDNFSDDTTITLTPDIFKYIPDIVVGPLIVSHEGSGLWGKIKLSGGVSKDIIIGALSSAYVALDFTGLSATLDLDFSVNSATTYTYERDLASYSPVGIEIPGFFSLGPFIKLKAGIEFTSASVMSLNNVGFTATVPDSGFKLDLVKNSATSYGWGRPNVTPLKPTFSFAGVDVSLAVYIAPAVSIEMQIYEPFKGLTTIGNAEVDLQSPKLTTHMTSDPHVCANDNQNNLNFAFGIGMKAFAEASFADIWEGSYTLFERNWPLAQTCVAF